MRILTNDDVQNVSGGGWGALGGVATSAISGLISGSRHRNWMITVSIDALLNAGVAYFLAPTAILNVVAYGAVAHTVAYVGADYASRVDWNQKIAN